MSFNGDAYVKIWLLLNIQVGCIKMVLIWLSVLYNFIKIKTPPLNFMEKKAKKKDNKNPYLRDTLVIKYTWVLQDKVAL